MTSRSLEEYIPLREDHTRTDSTQYSESTSSISFAPGPGALTARFLVWVGNTGLDTLQAMVISRRLVVIKKTVRAKPYIFTNPMSSQDVQIADRVYDDLQELCRGGYPFDLQRRAARVILEISFLRFISVSSVTSPDNWTATDRWNRWNALLRVSTASFTHGEWPQGGSKEDFIMSMDVGLSSIATVSTGYTTDTRKTVNSSSNRTWKSVRLAQQRAVTNVGTRAKLASIKRAVRKRPHIFTTAQGSHQVQEVDRIFNDLANLTRPWHSLGTRRKVVRLVLEIAVMISGPIGVVCSRIPLEDDGVAAVSYQLWDDLVLRSDVQALLTIGS